MGGDWPALDAKTEGRGKWGCELEWSPSTKRFFEKAWPVPTGDAFASVREFCSDWETKWPKKDRIIEGKKEICLLSDGLREVGSHEVERKACGNS